MSRVRTLVTTAALIAVTISLSAPLKAQCIPQNFPDDWLQQQEPPGHTIARHVGLSDQQLTNRLQSLNPPRAAGTYPASQLPDPNYRAAQTTIAQALANDRHAINNWANNANPGELRRTNYQAAATVGRVATRQQPNNVFDTRTFCTILRASGGGGCYLLTSFPTPAAQGYCD